MLRAGPSSQESPRVKGENGNGDARHAAAPDARQYIEIGDAGRSRRWIGILTYALLFAAVCAILIVLFVRFTGSMRLAVGLVVFMVSYMLLMGWWASRGNRQG